MPIENYLDLLNKIIFTDISNLISKACATINTNICLFCKKGTKKAAAFYKLVRRPIELINSTLLWTYSIQSALNYCGMIIVNAVYVYCTRFDLPVSLRVLFHSSDKLHLSKVRQHSMYDRGQRCSVFSGGHPSNWRRGLDVARSYL